MWKLLWRILGHVCLPLLCAAWQLFFYPFFPHWFSFAMDAIFMVSIVFLLSYVRGFVMAFTFGLLLDTIAFPFLSFGFLRYPLVFFLMTALFERFFTNRSHISFIVLTIACRGLIFFSHYTVWYLMHGGDAAQFFPFGISKAVVTLLFDVLFAWIFSHLHHRLHQVPIRVSSHFVA